MGLCAERARGSSRGTEWIHQQPRQMRSLFKKEETGERCFALNCERTSNKGLLLLLSGAEMDGCTRSADEQAQKEERFAFWHARSTNRYSFHRSVNEAFRGLSPPSQSTAVAGAWYRQPQILQSCSQCGRARVHEPYCPAAAARFPVSKHSCGEARMPRPLPSANRVATGCARGKSNRHQWCLPQEQTRGMRRVFSWTKTRVQHAGHATAWYIAHQIVDVIARTAKTRDSECAHTSHSKRSPHDPPTRNCLLCTVGDK